MKHFYQDIQGWFDFQNLYKDMVRKHNNAKFVEVGAWKGKSTCFLAVEILNQKKKIKLDAIDSYEYLTDEFSYNKDAPNVFKRNIKPFKFIKPIFKNSLKAAKLYKNKSIDFIFFDSEHSEEYAMKEIKAWYPKVKIGGYMGGHDYVCFVHPDPKYVIGVGKAVNKIFDNNFKLYPGKTDKNGNLYGPSWLHKKRKESIIG